MSNINLEKEIIEKQNQIREKEVQLRDFRDKIDKEKRILEDMKTKFKNKIDELYLDKIDERKRIEEQYIKNILLIDETASDVYIVFDEKGNIKGAKKLILDNGERLEDWLKENKLYAHCSQSFDNRPADFYNLSFLEQLKLLGWSVRNGKLKGTEW